MKKLLGTLLVFTLINNIFADISVKSFRKLENDMTARIDAPKQDQNGDVCAIIKVVTDQTGFIWEPDGLGIISSDWKNGEYWLYIPYGAKHLTIKHDKLGILRDYMYPLPIEKATVYELILTMGKVVTTIDETIESQWLVINSEPANSGIYINDVFMQQGVYQGKLKPGNYNYRIEAPLYHTEAGNLEISDSKKELNIKLKPAFGYISVNSAPENEATVIIDGKQLTSTTPCKSEELTSGEHTIKVLKDMFQPKTLKINVSDGQTQSVNFDMIPNFAELSITAPIEADIYINGVQKSKNTWNGRLNAGIYSIEARLDKYKTAIQDIEVIAGDKKLIDLQPSPIYGTLDIVTFPSGASILINGKDYGSTPNTIYKLLIGDYKVQIFKAGYVTVNKTLSVTEGENISMNENLIISKRQTSNAKIIEHIDKPSILNNIYVGVGIALTMNKNAERTMSNANSNTFRLGFLKEKYGVYTKVTTDFSSEKDNYSGSNIQNGFYYQTDQYNALSSKNRFGIIGGVLVNTKPLLFFAGGGWGYYNNLIESKLYNTIDNSFVKAIKLILDDSTKGFETEGGVGYKVGHFSFSVGVSTIKFKYSEINLGLGFIL